MEDDTLLQIPALQIVFSVLYIIIFFTGIVGNLLVVIVVFRKKSMQTIKNIFITNLAVSDIMICLIAVSLTPLSFFMKEWILGETLCALLPMMMCVLVHVSTFTCATIAVQRYNAILNPLQPKMRLRVYFIIAVFIWIISVSVSLPLGAHNHQIIVENGREICVEIWRKKEDRLFFTLINLLLQFLIPGIISTYCYLKISLALDRRSSIARAFTESEVEQRQIQSKRRTNKMMIYVVMIFFICWMPLNVFHIIREFNPDISYSSHDSLIFFTLHLLAMSSTTFNPLLYNFMSEKFKTEFKDLLSRLLRK